MSDRFMELMQAGHHFLFGRYLAYVLPRLITKGGSILLFSPLDKSLRGIARKYLGSALTNPLRLGRKLHYQSVMIIQPVDFMPNGSQNMCDGCPDMTVYDGQLVWSCRLEELKSFGSWVRTVPQPDGAKVG